MVMKTTSSHQSETLIRAFCQVFSCSKAMEVFLSDQFVALKEAMCINPRRTLLSN